jgi:hypothetical protein
MGGSKYDVMAATTNRRAAHWSAPLREQLRWTGKIVVCPAALEI